MSVTLRALRSTWTSLGLTYDAEHDVGVNNVPDSFRPWLRQLLPADDVHCESDGRRHRTRGS